MGSDYGQRARLEAVTMWTATGMSVERACGPCLVRAGSRGPGDDGGHGVLVVADCAASGVRGAAAGRVRSGAGGRCDGDVDASDVRGVGPATGWRPMVAARAFRTSADGAGWSEGCGVLVLKRLSDAERDGDRDPGVDPGLCGQPGRAQPGTDGAEWSEPAAGDPCGAVGERSEPGRHRRGGGARHGDQSWGSDRGWRTGGGVWADAA